VAGAQGVRDQTERRRQGLRGELHRSRHDVRFPKGHPLDGRQVRDDEDLAGLTPEVLQDGRPEGRPLGRVGTRAEFVDQEQAPSDGRRQHGDEAPDVGRESAEVLSQVLLVADVGHHVGEARQDCPLVSRDGETRLGHQDDEADRLEGDGLAAGVGTRDDEDLRPLVHLQVQGDDRLTTSPGLDRQEGVTGPT
jgi:hypothetical protein